MKTGRCQREEEGLNLIAPQTDDFGHNKFCNDTNYMEQTY